MMTPGGAFATAMCSIRLSPGGHSTVSRQPAHPRAGPRRADRRIDHSLLSRRFVQRRGIERRQTVRRCMRLRGSCDLKRELAMLQSLTSLVVRRRRRRLARAARPPSAGHETCAAAEKSSSPRPAALAAANTWPTSRRQQQRHAQRPARVEREIDVLLHQIQPKARLEPCPPGESPAAADPSSSSSRTSVLMTS